MELSNCVYRFLDKDEKIIYVGKTKQLNNRMRGHKHLPDTCYKECRWIEYIQFKNESEMGIAEIYFINKYKPKYNKKDKWSGKVYYSIPKLDKLFWSPYHTHNNSISTYSEWRKLHKLPDTYRLGSTHYWCALTDNQFKEYEKMVAFYLPTKNTIITDCVNSYFLTQIFREVLHTYINEYDTILVMKKLGYTSNIPMFISNPYNSALEPLFYNVVPAEVYNIIQEYKIVKYMDMHDILVSTQ